MTFSNKDKKLEEIKEEGKKIFLAEQQEKLRNAIEVMFRLRLYETAEDLREIKRFFHSIKGSAGVFDYLELVKIAQKADGFLNEVISPAMLNHKCFSFILEGVAGVKKELGFLSTTGKQSDRINYSDLMSKNEKEDEENNQQVEYILKMGTGAILCVDDDESILEILKSIFIKMGYRVIAKSNPQDALDILKYQEFDLIVLDVMMPVMTGFELCFKIRNEKIETPVMFLTSEQGVNNKVKALKIGADDYIIKPFDVNELVLRVTRAVENEREHKEKVFVDELTGAYTERLFQENYKIACYKNIRKKEDFAISMIDLDDFKNINNTFGYEAGNKILKDFYVALQTGLKVSAQIYRYVQDKFLVLFPASTSENAFREIEGIRRTFSKNPIDPYSDKPCYLTFSAGVVGSYGNTENILEIIENVKGALFEAKQEGKNRVHFRKVNLPAIESIRKKRTFSRILIIDDNMSVTHMIKKHLENLDYEVDTAINGEKGLFRAMLFKPDLILVDILLPVVDGFEVIKEIKSNPVHINTKIIIMTSFSKKEYVEKCAASGVKDFLIKPFSMDELEGRIKKLLDEARAQTLE